MDVGAPFERIMNSEREVRPKISSRQKTGRKKAVKKAGARRSGKESLTDQTSKNEVVSKLENTPTDISVG